MNCSLLPRSLSFLSNVQPQLVTPPACSTFLFQQRPLHNFNRLKSSCKTFSCLMVLTPGCIFGASPFSPPRRLTVTYVEEVGHTQFINEFGNPLASIIIRSSSGCSLMTDWAPVTIWGGSTCIFLLTIVCFVLWILRKLFSIFFWNVKWLKPAEILLALQLI